MLKQFIIGLISLIGFSSPPIEIPSKIENNLNDQKIQNPLNPDELALTENSIEIVGETKYDFSSQPVAVVAPHHLLAGHMIAKTYQTLAQFPITKIILIGPDHNDYIKTPFATSDNLWGSKYGNLEPEIQTIHQLQTLDMVSLDNQTTFHEHSIYTHLAFISHYLPEAKVVPIIVASRVSVLDLNELANFLDLNCMSDCVVVGSVDFSHYLYLDQANKNDLETWKIIESKNIDELLKLNDSFLDSPTTMALISLYSDLKKSTKIVNHENSNSAILLNDPLVSSTSYFSLSYE